MLSFKSFQWNILDIQIKFKIHHIYHWRKKNGKSKHQFCCFYCGWKLDFRLKGKDKQYSVLCLNMFVHWLITGEGFHPRKIKLWTRPNKPKGERGFSLCDIKDTNHVKLRANKEAALSFTDQKFLTLIRYSKCFWPPSSSGLSCFILKY